MAIDRTAWDDAIVLAHAPDATSRGRFLAFLASRAEALCAQAPEANPGEPYGRRVLHAGPCGEVMLAGWCIGARCAPHDHGGARGIVAILRGRFTETAYAAGLDGLRAVARQSLAPGERLEVAPDAVHDMHAHDAGVTLHLYAPAIQGMRVYDVRSRATLEVTGDSGAWVPEDASRVVERVAWRDTPGASRAVR